MKNTRFRVSPKHNFFAIVMTILIMLMPVSALFEFALTGRIDLYRITEGRGHLPVWVLLCISGVTGTYILINLTIPWLNYVVRGHIFTLNDAGIWIGGIFLANDEVIGFSQKYAVTYLKTRDRTFKLHAGWTENGVPILNERFENILVI